MAEYDFPLHAYSAASKAARQAALLAGAEALDKCEKLRVFAEQLGNDGNPVLLGFAYFIQKILKGEEKCSK
jgi:hypothetical protein